MRRILLIVLAAICAAVPARAQQRAAVSTLLGAGSSESASPRGIAVAPDGGIIVAGDVLAPVALIAFGPTPVDMRVGAGGSDFFVARLRADGTALEWITYLGGSGADQARALAIGADGSIYVAANTSSTNIGTLAGLVDLRAPGAAAQDVLVVKLAANGATRGYAALLGGPDVDGVSGLVVNGDGSVVVAGSTSSAALCAIATPFLAGVQPSKSGLVDGYVLRLDSLGLAVTAGTFLGGSGDDEINGLAVDVNGRLLVAGTTESSSAGGGTPFPTLGALPGTRGVTAVPYTNLGGPSDVVVTALTPSLDALVFSTYFGGTDQGLSDEGARAVATSPDGSFYLVGATDASDMPTVNALDPTYAPGALRSYTDGFVARLTWNGSALGLAFSTYVGGPRNDAVESAAVDPDGVLWAVGTTANGLAADGFPAATADAFDPSFAGTSPNWRSDAFVLALTSAGAKSYLSFWGSDLVEAGQAISADATGEVYVAGQTESTTFPAQYFTPGAVDTTTEASDLFVFRIDADNLPDNWELTYFGNLAQTDAGDPDRDGRSNLEELQAGSNPAEARRYFAEGANGEGIGFETRIALMNPHELPTMVTLEFLPLGAAPITYGPLPLAAHQRLTVDTWTAVAGLASASFSTIVRSTLSVVADRTMRWDASGYASHAETAIAAPSLTWYLAEGATHSGFRLFYLLQNPNPTEATVQVTYLRTGQSPITVTCRVPARTRKNIYANAQLCPDDIYVGPHPTPDRFEADDVSAVFEVTNGQPIIVERAMYRGTGFAAGTATAGVTSPATSWFLAEGATGDLFDTYVLLANPSNTDAAFDLDLLRLTQTPSLISPTTINDPFFCAPVAAPCPLVVPARERRTIRLDGIPGAENDGVSTVVRVTNGVGVLVERAMWWPFGYTSWAEGHASFGTTTTGTRWGLAEGEVGGPRAVATYVLVANTSGFDAAVRATLVFEDGTTAATDLTVGANSRANFNFTPATIAGYPALAPLFPPAVIAAGKKFGVVVESLPTGGGTAQIVVERAMYSADGRAPSFLPYWPAGTNALGTKLRN